MSKGKIGLGLAGAGSFLALVVAAIILLPITGASPAPDTTAATPSAADQKLTTRDGQSEASVAESADNNSVGKAQVVKKVITPPGDQAAPDFRGIVGWINSPPLSLPELQGKVVLVDFWTYSCINCQRTLPFVRDWHHKYSSKGLVVVGVHSPEFTFEKDETNVREAVIREQVAWPVAMDNDFRTWRAYQNRWWPHKFLIDQDGLIRYDHIGEGAYEETELHIRNLLTEAGYDVSQIPIGVQ